MKRLTDLQKLALDTYNGSVEKYSKSEAENAIRTAISDACGGEWNFYNFNKNKWDVFQVLAEVLSVGTNVLFLEKFSDFAEIKDVELGDTNVFEVESQELFRVASIANGTTDIRRQKLYNGKMSVETEKLGIKIYEEFDKFMAGRVDWTKLVNKVEQSYAYDVSLRIYNAIYGSYDDLVAPYAVSGVFDEEKLIDAIAHVEASTGQTAVVYGTKKALAKITTAKESDAMLDKLNAVGHYGVFKGTELMELPQGHLVGTSTFGVADDFLLIIPNGEKIVKIVLEGDAYVYDTEAGARNDEQIEFFFGRRAGIGVLKADQYAMYKLS